MVSGQPTSGKASDGAGAAERSQRQFGATCLGLLLSTLEMEENQSPAHTSVGDDDDNHHRLGVQVHLQMLVRSLDYNLVPYQSLTTFAVHSNLGDLPNSTRMTLINSTQETADGPTMT